MTSVTIDDRPYATWKRSMALKGWIVRSAIPHDSRLFAPAIVLAAEESVYAKEREAVLRFKGLVEDMATEGAISRADEAEILEVTPPPDAAYGLESGRVRSDYPHTTGNTQRQDLLLHAQSQPLSIELEDRHARSVSDWQEPDPEGLYKITICGIPFENCTADQLKRVRAATTNLEAMRVVLSEVYSKPYPELLALKRLDKDTLR